MFENKYTCKLVLRWALLCAWNWAKVLQAVPLPACLISVVPVGAIVPSFVDRGAGDTG